MNTQILRCFGLALLLLWDGGVSLHAAAAFREFYVSPTGAETNPGTIQKPFRTLNRARDAVREVNQQMTGDIIVHLRGGTYPVIAPIEFGSADSGRNGFRVIYRAFEKEEPVLAGGVTVTNWTPDRDGLFKAALDWNGKLRGLFVNGRRAKLTEATFQGQGAWGEFIISGSEPWAETSGKTLDGIAFDAAKLPPFAQPSDVELLQHRIWNFLVMGVRDIVTESNQTIVKLQQPYGAIAATMAWKCNIDPQGTFTVRNAYELLKSPGLFYFNRRTHTLYYYPRPGEDMSRAVVIAPLSEGLLRIAGDSTGRRAKNLAFERLTFSYDHWLLNRIADSRGMVGVQSLGLYTKFRADGNWHKSHYNICDLPQGTVELRNCEKIRFERNRFIHLSSGVAISLVNDVVDSAVVGNVFLDLAGNAINVGHPQHYIIGDGPLYPAGVEGACSRDLIQNNWIRQVSLDFKQEEAISGFFTQEIEISHNDIQGVPYGGIALGWWWGDSGLPPSMVPRNNVIVRNRVIDTQQELPDDGGAIYVLGKQPGGRIERNYVQSPTRCLYADDGSAYWTISGNVVDPLVNSKQGKAKGSKVWLYVWTPRIHDLKIVGNYTTTAAVQNKGTNCVPVGTRVEDPLSAQARAIADDAGLENDYEDIALPLLGNQ